MSNLIITVISIALIAVAALMSAYYVGDIFSNSTAKANASLLLSQSRQLQNANLQYLIAHGSQTYTDIQGKLDAPVLENYTQPIPILNLNTYSYKADYTYSNQPTATTIEHATCSDTANAQLLNGAYVYIARESFRSNGKDVTSYWMIPIASGSNCYTSVTISGTGSLKNPLVQMCLQINRMTTLPSGLSYDANGLPYSQGSATATPVGMQEYYASPGQYNYCYLSADVNSAVGANNSLIFTFVN